VEILDMTLLDQESRLSFLRPLIALLEQLGGVVSQLSDKQYAQKPVGVIDSSVGGHVRHCLDHVRSLINATETGEINYEHRRRGTMIESSTDAACAQVAEFVNELSAIDDQDVLDMPLNMTVLLSADEPAIVVESTVGRELAYVLAHTIHHNALIAAMVNTLGGWLPARFGYAPSTMKSLEAKACAR
jgi:uncharacterized damage-inducible protein DinB